MPTVFGIWARWFQRLGGMRKYYFLIRVNWKFFTENDFRFIIKDAQDDMDLRRLKA
jgi:hypothetical protein